MESNISFSGKLSVELVDKHGNTLQTVEKNNTLYALGYVSLVSNQSLNLRMAALTGGVIADINTAQDYLDAVKAGKYIGYTRFDSIDKQERSTSITFKFTIDTPGEYKKILFEKVSSASTQYTPNFSFVNLDELITVEPDVRAIVSYTLSIDTDITDIVVDTDTGFILSVGKNSDQVIQKMLKFPVPSTIPPDHIINQSKMSIDDDGNIVSKFSYVVVVKEPKTITGDQIRNTLQSVSARNANTMFEVSNVSNFTYSLTQSHVGHKFTVFEILLKVTTPWDKSAFTGLVEKLN